MEKWKKLKAVKAFFGLVSEAAYLGVFAAIVVYRFFITTLFTERLEEAFNHTIAVENLTPVVMELFGSVLLVVVVCRLLLARKYVLRQYLLAIAIFLCAAWIDRMHSNAYLMVYILLLLGAKDIPFSRILKLYFLVEACFGITTIVCSQIGLVENLVRDTGSAKSGIAFGFIYPTDFAAHVFFLALVYWFLRNKRITYIESGAVFLAGGFLYVLAKARCSSLLMMLMAGMMFVWAYRERKGLGHRRSRPLELALLWMPVLCAAMIHMLSILYSPDGRILEKIDRLLSRRLSLVKRAIDIYGFQLWGSDIKMTGYGSSTGYVEKYFYIDSSFMQYSLLYGVAALGLILFLLFLAGSRAYERGDFLLLLILAFASIHGVIEQHLLEIEYFPFLLTIFAKMDQDMTDEKRLLKGWKWKKETSLP